MKQPLLSCRVCGHRAESIFCSLAGAHLEKLDRGKTVCRYEKGEVVFYQDTPALAVHCLYSGRIKLYQTGPKGESQIIRLLGPGEIFGYRALLANEPYSATAEALEATVICTITKQTLFELLKQSADITLRLLAKLAGELRTSEEQVLALAQETVRQRTARLLLFLAEGNKDKSRSGLVVKVPLARSEMAQMVSTNPETFSRTLRYLAEQGMIKVSREEILITNFKALKRVVSL